ncbi:MAG: response regulator [Actinomycetota bacterium]
MDYAVLLVQGSGNDQSRLTLAFARAAPVRLRIAEDADEARAYLSGEGIHANRDANPLPQLILLDLELQGGSGLVVLRWIRSEPLLKHIPVIALTASAESSDVDRAYALGANSFILTSVRDEALSDIAKGIGDYAALLAQRPGRRSPAASTPQPGYAAGRAQRP